MRTSSIFICIMLLISISYGQMKLGSDSDIRLAPQVMNYQGYLTDDQDIPITDPGVSMTFSIWNAVSSGSQLWFETQTVAVDKGIFSVILGSGTPIPFSVFTGGTGRWLQLVVAGQTLSPRTRITASPYAYTATYADTAVYAQNVALPDLDARYVNVAGPDSIYSSASAPVFKVKAQGSYGGIRATRNTTSLTDPTIFTENSGSGASLLGRGHYNDGASPGIIGNHDNGRPAIYGYYGSSFVLAPSINAGICGYSGTGPAIHARGGSQTGLDVDSTFGKAINVDFSADDGLFIGYSASQGVEVDSCSLTAIYMRKAGYNGVGIDYAIADGYAVLYPGRDAFSLWQTAARHGLYLNRTNYNGVNILTADSHGVYINTAGKRGFTINSAGDDGYAVVYAVDDGLYVDSASSSGVDVDYAPYGVDVGIANNTGFYVGTTNSTGYSAVYVNNAASNGFRVFTAGNNGLDVNTAARHGVYINTADSSGVRVNNAGVEGVYVRKAANNGVQIDTATYYGVRVLHANYGYRVDSTDYDGIYLYHTADDGFYLGASGDDGVYISSAGGDGFYCSNAGNRGMYIGTTGSYGIYVSNPATYGIYANSTNQRGGYFRNANNSYYALTAWNNTGTGGTIRGMYIQGHGYATGGWQTFLGDGKTGFALTSPDMEIAVSGTGSLVDGQAAISFDGSFMNAFSKDVALRVIVTPTSECNGVFVKSKSSTGFEVKELGNGRSNATFDWIAIGRMKGYEQTIYTKPLQAVPHVDVEMTEPAAPDRVIRDHIIEPQPEIQPAQDNAGSPTSPALSNDKPLLTTSGMK